jgi:hypothetical protein
VLRLKFPLPYLFPLLRSSVVACSTCPVIGLGFKLGLGLGLDLDFSLESEVRG